MTGESGDRRPVGDDSGGRERRGHDPGGQRSGHRRPDGKPIGGRSGLRDPRAAVRGVGAVALAAESLVLLLAIQPIRVTGDRLPGVTVGLVAVLAFVCLLLAGLLRYRWAWWAAGAAQVGLLAAGLVLHVVLAVLGILFGLLWLYVLHVRRTVLGRSRDD